jgi:hypothetical protein
MISPEKVCAALPVWATPRQQVIRRVMRKVFKVFTSDQFLPDFGCFERQRMRLIEGFRDGSSLS